MNELEENIRRFIARAIADRARMLGLSETELSGDLNLVHSGILDSISFIELISRIEKEFGREVDFGEMDPAEFTTFEGLVRCVSRPCK